MEKEGEKIGTYGPGIPSTGNQDLLEYTEMCPFQRRTTFKKPDANIYRNESLRVIFA